ncbi:MAG: PDZ domain-containing protein, partial [Chitinophagaceae bacterium]
LISTKAQDAPKATERKEIIIREKAGKEEKMTIVVDGDKVTINGKPLAEYDGENIIIRKKNMESFAPYARTYPRTPAMPRIPRVPAVPHRPELFEFSFDEDLFNEVKTEPRARLGVVSEKDAKGAKLTEVMAESAAAKAGLKVGDIITAVDGKKVDGPESLLEQIKSKKPGQESEITYQRDKKTKKMKVKLGSVSGSSARVFRFDAPEMEIDIAPQIHELENLYRAEGNQFKAMENELRALDRNKFRFEMDREIPGSSPKLGVRIEDTEDGKGVKVIEVTAGSAAEKAGFKKDDIIIYINDKKIEHTDHARGALREMANKTSYPVTVQRNGQPFNITVKTPRELKKADL